MLCAFTITMTTGEIIGPTIGDFTDVEMMILQRGVALEEATQAALDIFFAFVEGNTKASAEAPGLTITATRFWLDS